jgi:chitin-binding protein
MAQYQSDFDDQLSPTPYHGHVYDPGSRAWNARQMGLIDEGALNQCEGGKFFPETQGGLSDKIAPNDVPNAVPPADGKIASAGQEAGRVLDDPTKNWPRKQVSSGDAIDISWFFTAAHLTRRWNYFITKPGWDPTRPLSRDQFEAKPFTQVESTLDPFWQHNAALKPANPTKHSIRLPERSGYHVLLGVWEVADTGNAFYQVIDLDFVKSDIPDRLPTPPGNLRAETVTGKSVKLAWNASSGASPITTYRITRNGITTIDVAASLLTWTDESVEPNTRYTYFVSAIDENGAESAPGNTIMVTTLGGEDTPPTAPGNLHSMGETATSVSLMWGASLPEAAIASYIIYREGKEVQRVSGSSQTWNDTGLTPNTRYRYFVAALDTHNRLSVPSNVLTIQTKSQDSGGNYPTWKLNESYHKGDIVTYKGQLWKCVQDHISYTDTWAPDVPEVKDILWSSLA